MSGKHPLANQEDSPQPNHHSSFISASFISASFISASFLTFRLAFIPAFTLTHAAHGPLWISLVLGLMLAFGGEWLARQRGERSSQIRRDLLVVVASLFLIGLFPEETPIQLILWAGIGLAWGSYQPRTPQLAPATLRWAGYVLGALIGLTGLIGPGSWLMAILLLTQLRNSTTSP